MRNLSKTIVSEKATLINKEINMKLTIVTLLVIVMEALGYGWLLGEENEKLQAEVDKLNHQVVMLQSENSRIRWDLMLEKAGVQDEN